MDNSSLIVDSSHFKMKIGEVIEGSVNIMEKGTASIFKELNKMREEYSGLISKFLDYCEKEGISLDFLEDNSRSTSIERESSTISLNFKKKQLQQTTNPFKIPTIELKKFRMDTKIKASIYAQSSSSSLVNRANSKDTKLEKNKLNKYSKHTQFRSLTPVGSGPKTAIRDNQSSSSIHKSQRDLPRIEKLKNESPISKIDPRLKTDSSSLPYSYLNNSKSTLSKSHKAATTTTTTPKSKNQKNDIKNYIMYNQNNNYTKKFIFKQTIESVNGSKNSNTKEKNSLKLNKNDVINDFNGNESKLFNNNLQLNQNSKLNISVRNVNINLNNNLNETDAKKFDDRKLSILDIAGCGPLISIENLIHNDSQNKDEEDLDNSFKKSDASKEIPNRLLFDNFDNKFDKFCFSLAASDVVPLKMRLIFAKLSKKVNKEYPPVEILKDHSNLLNENIKSKDNYLSFYLENRVEEKIICKPFNPSKTAQNSLNFISKEDEIMLSKENICNLPAKDEILGILKIVYILIRQNYTKIDDRLLADYLINKILVKLKIDNLKSLFQNLICNNLLLSNEQMTKITNIIDNNVNILNPSFILKSNKVVAYITFIIKEIYEYVTVQAQDGTPILNLRKHKNNLRKMKEKVAKIKKLLHDRKCEF